MERKVSNVILGIAGSEDRFTLKYGLFRFRLKIKPITTRQLIAISAEVAQIKDVKEDQEMFPALMAGSPDLIHIANIITIATGTKWRRIVKRAILNLSLSDINTLFKIVHKQSDPSPFFFTIILAKGRMNLLKKQE